MPSLNNKHVLPSLWRWVPSVYFGQGLSYAIVIGLAVIMYKTLGWSNVEITWYTSVLYLPWILKPLWSPLAEFFATKRWWLFVMEWIVALLLLAATLTFNEKEFIPGFIVFLLMAFASATFDMVSDGVYLLNLKPFAQAYFVGIRSMAYLFAKLVVLGGAVMLYGFLEHHMAPAPAWRIVFVLFALLSLVLGLYHWWQVPESESYIPFSWQSLRRSFGGTREIVRTFVQLPQLRGLIVFLVFYNFGEAQLIKIVPLFLLDTTHEGGLALSAYWVGIIDSTSLISMVIGGVIAGWILSRYGLKRSLIWLTSLMALGTIGYWPLALSHSHLIAWPLIVTGISYFTFGMGTSACMMFIMLTAGQGKHRMSTYAITTALMNFGMMLPGAISGSVQHALGYSGFFLSIIVLSAGIVVMSTWVIRCCEG
jgi:PAT family beta-lactamase induction signal transducer AmpG